MLRNAPHCSALLCNIYLPMGARCRYMCFYCLPIYSTLPPYCVPIAPLWPPSAPTWYPFLGPNSLNIPLFWSKYAHFRGISALFGAFSAYFQGFLGNFLFAFWFLFFSFLKFFICFRRIFISFCGFLFNSSGFYFLRIVFYFCKEFFICSSNSLFLQGILNCFKDLDFKYSRIC